MPEALPTAHEAFRSVPRYLKMVKYEMTMRDFGPGAFVQGWRTFAEYPVLAAAAIAALIVAAAPWLRWWSEGAEPADRAPAAVRPALLTALAGLAMFAGAWAPIVATRYPVDSRMCLAPMAGLLLLAGPVLDALGRALRASPPLAAAARPAAAAGLMFVLVIFTVTLIGVQHAFQLRSQMDLDEGAQLRSLLPDPAPHTFFLPLNVQSLPVRTWSRRFDEHVFSVWGVPWSSRWFVERLYRRADVHCGYHWPWPDQPRLTALWGVDARGVRYALPMGGPFPEDPEGGFRVPWSAVVPFEVDADGRVHFITRIEAEQPDGTLLSIDIPQLQSRALPGRVFRIAYPPHATP